MFRKKIVSGPKIYFGIRVPDCFVSLVYSMLVWRAVSEVNDFNNTKIFAQHGEGKKIPYRYSSLNLNVKETVSRKS
jgi:hypothetical protein